MTTQHNFTGMNRKQLQRIFEAHGGVVEVVRRTGEHRYRHPLLSSHVTINARRKDTARALSAYVRKAVAAWTAAHGEVE